MSQVKLNLGCGRVILPGWVNIDNSPSVLLTGRPWIKNTAYRLGVISKEQFETSWPEGIVWRDLTKKWPDADNSVDRIYSSHFLEHLDESQGQFILRQCFRTLKADGVFRLVVPDLVYHAERYLRELLESNDPGRGPHDNFLYNIYGAYMPNGGRFGLRHRYMYDWMTLKTILHSIGFTQVVRQNYQVSLDPEMASLDNRPEDSLHIDIRK
jgi:predicted SAM-dependent methyltransferase